MNIQKKYRNRFKLNFSLTLLLLNSFNSEFSSADTKLKSTVSEAIQAIELSIPCVNEESTFACQINTDLRDSFISAVVKQVSEFSPEQYNLIAAELLLKYQQAFVKSDFQSMKNLVAIAAYLDQATETERQGEWESHPAVVILDDVFWAWTVSAGVGSIKGFVSFKNMKNSGKNLMFAFEDAVKKTASKLPKKKQALLITGLGASVGVPHALYLHLKERKISTVQKIQAMNARMLSATFERVRLVQGYSISTASIRKIPEIIKLSEALKYFKTTAMPEKSIAIDAATELLLIKTEKLYQLSN